MNAFQSTFDLLHNQKVVFSSRNKASCSRLKNETKTNFFSYYINAQDRKNVVL